MLDVLVADDDPNVRESLTRALTEAGHRVEQAHDGAQAIVLAHGGQFDVAILDVQMPRLGGLSVLRRLRRWAPDTEVVLMTSFGNVLDAVTAFRDGAVDYLVKPFDPVLLAQKVSRSSARRREP
ncbi:MAG: response regulator, partial [Polyangiales bacterium]